MTRRSTLKLSRHSLKISTRMATVSSTWMNSRKDYGASTFTRGPLQRVNKHLRTRGTREHDLKSRPHPRSLTSVAALSRTLVHREREVFLNAGGRMNLEHREFSAHGHLAPPKMIEIS